MIQTHLNFTEPKPTGSNQEVNVLLAYLRGKRDWTTAKIISKALHLTDRKIRALASQSDGHILSGPGCPGYKHLLDAQPKEIAEVAARLEHQAKAMLTRAIRIRNAYHEAPYQP